MDVDGKTTYTTGTRTIQIGTIDYTNLYVPFGIKFSKNFYGEEHSGWAFTATIEDDISRWASHGNGVRGSIELQKRFKYVSIAVEPFIRYWRFQEDNTPVHDANGNEVGTVREPVNHTTEIGVNWKVRF